MNWKLRIALLFVLAMFGELATAAAPQGTAFTYQGLLKQNGTPYNGSVDLVFDLFDAAVDGQQIGPSLPFTAGNGNAVDVQNGAFDVKLDFGPTAFNRPTSDERYLRITVNGNAVSPRTQIQNAPYALQSRTAELSYGVSDGSISTAQIDSSAVQRRISSQCAAGSSIRAVNADGSVQCQADTSSGGTITGVTAGNGLSGGGTSGTVSLALAPPLSITANSASPTLFASNSGAGGYALRGETFNPTGTGLLAQAIISSGSAAAIEANGYGDTGYGVIGFARSNTGANTGVLGQTNSPTGYGVSANGGIDALYAYTGVSGSHGVEAYGASIGVRGQSPNIGVSGTGSSYGLFGTGGTAVYASGVNTGMEAHASNGSGLIAYGSYSGVGANGTAYGLYAYGDTAVYADVRSGTTNGFGVYAYSRATTGPGNGVYGQSDSPTGVGVSGYSSSGIGVAGSSNTGFAGKFIGSVWVTGVIFKGGGGFQIDHPLDPANKYLFHSFVESPDMKNVFDGVATLDPRGEAWVQLPDYFEASNRDFRYLLTALGRPAAGLYVADEIKGNRFRIAGGGPGQRISWQVTGIRHDAFAEANRIVPEVEKAKSERGKYLHPALFGEPASKGINQLAVPAPPPVPAAAKKVPLGARQDVPGVPSTAMPAPIRAEHGAAEAPR